MMTAHSTKMKHLLTMKFEPTQQGHLTDRRDNDHAQPEANSVVVVDLVLYHDHEILDTKEMKSTYSVTPKFVLIVNALLFSLDTNSSSCCKEPGQGFSARMQRHPDLP